jgi:hypothetical protein
MLQHCYNQLRSARFRYWSGFVRLAIPPKSAEVDSQRGSSAGLKRGQVAQVVERSPEKAGVGGSTPSLATIIPKDLSEIWPQEAGKFSWRATSTRQTICSVAHKGVLERMP